MFCQIMDALKNIIHSYLKNTKEQQGLENVEGEKRLEKKKLSERRKKKQRKKIRK